MMKVRSFWKMLVGLFAALFATFGGSQATDAVMFNEPEAEKVAVEPVESAVFPLIKFGETVYSIQPTEEVEVIVRPGEEIDPSKVAIFLPRDGKIPVIRREEWEKERVKYRDEAVIVIGEDNRGRIYVPISIEKVLLQEYRK